MTGGKLIPVILLGVAAAAVGGTLLARMNRTAAPNVERPVAPVLHIADDKLNFGETWESHRFEWTLPVENRGTSTVKVSKASGSCSCLAIEPQEFEIEPGQSKNVKLAIDLRKDSTGDRYPFGVTVEFTFTHDPGRGPLEKAERFQVIGRVRRALSTPSAVYLGSHSDLIDKLPPVFFSVDGVVKLKSVTVTSPRADLRIERRTGEISGLRHEFDVVFTKRPSKGAIQGEFLLDAVMEDGKSIPSIRVRFHGSWIDCR